jgi:hypothetical protein
MNVEMKWVNVDASHFAGPYLNKEVSRFERQIPGARNLDVRMKREGEAYRAQVHVQALGRDWWVTGEGQSVAEGLSNAFNTLLRKVSEFKKFSRDKINKRFRKPKELVHQLY